MEAFIQDVTTSTFEQDVVEKSRSLPVVVDFWAAWCAPCRALKPVLEKLAREYEGRFILAKLDTDKEPEIAARFGIRGIPDVKAFVDGEVAGEFSGALPESGVRAFLERVMPSPSAKLRMEAKRALQTGDFETAESRLRDALGLDAADRQARLELVELLQARQAWPESESELAQIPERERDQRADDLAARIAFWKKAQTLEPAAELEAALARSPSDQALRLRLAERRLADKEFAAALEQLVEVVRADRGALREQARKAMLDIFKLAADQPELVAKYRRMLASALY